MYDTLASKCRNVRFFSPTWYRTFSESYKSRFLSGVMKAFYLLSTFANRESASIRQHFIQDATFRLRIRLSGMLLCQSHIQSATLRLRICFNSLHLHQPVLKGDANRSYGGNLLTQTCIYEPYTFHVHIIWFQTAQKVPIRAESLKALLHMFA
jgi:hypothetical protein